MIRLPVALPFGIRLGFNLPLLPICLIHVEQDFAFLAPQDGPGHVLPFPNIAGRDRIRPIHAHRAKPGQSLVAIPQKLAALDRLQLRAVLPEPGVPLPPRLAAIVRRVVPNPRRYASAEVVSEAGEKFSILLDASTT